MEAFFQDGVESADGERVVIAKNAVWSRIAAQQDTHRLRPLLKAIGVDNGSADDVVLQTGKTSVEKGFPIAFEPSGAGAIFRPTNVCHALTTDVQKVRGRDAACCFVIDSDKVGGNAGEIPID